MILGDAIHMPIYEYECNGCGGRHEFIQKFSENPKRKCPDCGKNRLRKLMSAAAFHLKGEGWYVTDFRDKDKKKKGDEDTGKAATASADEAGKGKSETKAADKSSEKSTETSSSKSDSKDSSATGGKSGGDTKKAATK